MVTEFPGLTPISGHEPGGAANRRGSQLALEYWRARVCAHEVPPVCGSGEKRDEAKNVRVCVIHQDHHTRPVVSAERGECGQFDANGRAGKWHGMAHRHTRYDKSITTGEPSRSYSIVFARRADRAVCVPALVASSLARLAVLTERRLMVTFAMISEKTLMTVRASCFVRPFSRSCSLHPTFDRSPFCSKVRQDGGLFLLQSKRRKRVVELERKWRRRDRRAPHLHAAGTPECPTLFAIRAEQLLRCYEALRKESHRSAALNS